MKVKMQFFIEESESYEWFEGVVQYYDKRAKSMLSTSVVMMKLFTLTQMKVTKNLLSSCTRG